MLCADNLEVGHVNHPTESEFDYHTSAFSVAI